MLRVFLDAVGLIAPGLDGWSASRSVLQGESAHCFRVRPPFTATLLPPNERRRLTPSIKLALQAAQEATEHWGLPARGLSSVFASTAGDAEIVDKICTALTLPDRPVSPIDFHNSVHNAAAGYWALATGSRLSSATLSAQDESFAVGLLETAALVQAELNPALLVAYDYPCPPPLDTAYPLGAPFAVALVLGPAKTAQSLAELVLRQDGAGQADRMSDVSLETLRQGNPAARSLPLLQVLARGKPKRVALPYLPHSRLVVESTPC